MLKQASLPDLFNVTSSLDSAAGATPCALPDGPRIDLFGRAVAPASLLAQPVPGGGVTDERHLWPTWFNLIRECRPDVIFGEQVEAAINHGWLDVVQSDLEGSGYACGAIDLCAAGVGAPHIRQRLFFVADTNDTRSQGWRVSGAVGERQRGSERSARARSSSRSEELFWQYVEWLDCRDGKKRPVEPGTFPVVDGVSARVGRLRAYGNAIVPQVAQTFIEAYLES